MAEQRVQTTTVPEGLVASQVRIGQQLPELVHPITATTVVLGAMATRDWRPMHHDRDFAVQHNGLQDIFMNTPNQAAWFDRYLSDWAGPTARLGRLGFAMRLSVFPGDLMHISGRVTGRDSDDAGCEWAGVELRLSVDGQVRTEADARIALPTVPGDNPWARRGDRWRP